MSVDRIQTGIRFTPETLKKITYIAKINHRSLNGQLEALAEAEIRLYEKEHGEIILNDE